MDLKAKTVLVTGGARRLGLAICRELAGAGARLLCHYHDSATGAEGLREELAAQGVQIQLLVGDLGREGGGAALARAAIGAAGRVDALVNNAGIFYETPLAAISAADWDAFHAINLKEPFFLSRDLGLHMRAEGGGAIVNIGDAGAESPWPSYLPYSLSKAGVVAMTRGLAKALAPEVRVNCVNPGPVLLPEDYGEAQSRKAVERTLLQRAGSAADVAKSVRFLLEGSDYITGAILPVDGGRGIH